jgi:hypothetical protein
MHSAIRAPGDSAGEERGTVEDPDPNVRRGAHKPLFLRTFYRPPARYRWPAVCPSTGQGAPDMNAKFLMAAVLTMCTAGCGYGIKAATDYNKKVDFSKYVSFFMMKGNSSGDPTLDARLISSVEMALTEKGWYDVAAGDGQAAVIVHTATDRNHTYQSFYDGWGGWHWEGPGSAGSFVEDYKPGTVVVTIFDARTSKAVWRGFATDVLSHGSDQNAKANADAAVSRIFENFPPGSMAALAYGPAPGAALPAGNVPPRIIFTMRPARLILIDGVPVYRPVAGTGLQRITNTRALILRDAAGMCYLKILDGWMEAYSLDSGSWSVSGVPPEGGAVALRQAAASGTVDLLDDVATKNASGVHLTDASAPTVVISTTPTVMIVTDGPMAFATIEGTSLQYVVNTSADVFREPTDQELYLFTSGRWFRSWKPEGPWRSVASGELPADFTRIPDGSPKASVKASIGGDRR